MLQLREVHTYYGDSHILQGLSLEVKAGQVVGLLGRNGAGKTTTIHSIIGFVPVRHGEILFKGEPITNHPAHAAAKKGVALVPQGRRLFPSLTVRENITLGARSRAGGWTVEQLSSLFPVLEQRAEQRASLLSGGEQQMVALARALMLNPELLLLDEPSEGLAPLVVREIARILLELKARNLSILLVEQNFSLATRLADYLYVMSRGTIVFEGTPEALQAKPEITTRYLGV